MKKIIIITLTIFFTLTIVRGQIPNWNWAHQVIGNDWSIGFDIATDANSNVYVCGFFIHSAKFGNQQIYSNQQRAFVVKYDSMGAFQWVNTFPCNNGSFADIIKIDSQNNILVLGYFSGTLTAGGYTLNTSLPNIDNFFLVKINPTGNVLWASQSNSSSVTQGTSITIDNSDNIYIAGNNSVPTTFGSLFASKAGMFILKYNSSGTPIQLINESGCLSNSINVSADNKLYFTGNLVDTTAIGNDTLFPTGYYQYIINGIDTDSVYTFDNDIIFICYDTSGNVVWDKQALSKSYDDWTYSSLDNLSNLYVCGNIKDTTNFWGTTIYSSGDNISYILKIDSLGNIIWYRYGQPISFNGFTFFQNIKSDNEYLYAVGFYFGVSSFANLTVFGNSSNQNSFILKLDSAGNGIWQISDTSNLARNSPFGLTLDQNKNISICGFFEDSVHFGTYNLNSLTNYGPNMFVANINSIAVNIQENENAPKGFYLSVSPNPFSTFATLELNSEFENSELKIYNSLGQQVQQQVINNKSTLINRQGLANGIYFLRVINSKGKMLSGKFIIR